MPENVAAAVKNISFFFLIFFRWGRRHDTINKKKERKIADIRIFFQQIRFLGETDLGDKYEDVLQFLAWEINYKSTNIHENSFIQ